MSRAKICVQLYTLRREMARLGVYETLKKLHELGFTSVEVSALEMTEANVSQLKKPVKTSVWRLLPSRQEKTS